MSIKRRIFLFHVIFLAIFLATFLFPGALYYSLALFNIFFILLVYSIKNINLGLRKYIFLVLPGLFLNSIFLFSALSLNRFFIFIFLFLGTIASYYYFKELRRRLIRDASFSAGAFSSWADTLAVLLVFTGSSFAYALPYFLNTPNYLLLLIILAILFIAIWQGVLSLGTVFKSSLLFTFLFLLAIIPIAWVLFFFPFNYNILGLILVLCYYFGLSFIRFYLMENLSIKKTKYNLIFFVTLLIILLTMIKWR